MINVPSRPSSSCTVRREDQMGPGSQAGSTMHGAYAASSAWLLGLVELPYIATRTSPSRASRHCTPARRPNRR